MSTPDQPFPSHVPVPRRPDMLRGRLRLAVLAGCVLVAGFFALPQVVGLSLGQARLREYAELSLSQALGRKVTVGGEVRLSSLPWMALRAGELVVDDAPGFGSDPFLTVERVTVDIRILPLFSRIVMPGAITLVSPVMHLKRDAADRCNWEGLPFFNAAVRDQSALVAPENGDGPPKSDAPAGWEVLPVPSGVRIQDAVVRYEDRRRGFSAALRHFTLVTGRGERFDFHLSFDVSGLDPAVEAQIHAKGTAGFDMDRLGLAVEGALLEASLSVPGDARFADAGHGVPWRMTLRAALDFDTASGHIALRDLSAQAPDAELTGQAELTGLLENLQAKASLSLRAGLHGPLGRALNLEPLSSHARHDQPPAQLQDPDGRKSSFLGFSSRVLPSERLKRPDDVVLEADVSASPDRLSVSALRLRLGEAAVTGRADYQTGPHPRLTAALSADGLDLDRIPWGGGGRGWVLPLTFLGNALGRITVDARSLTVAGVTLSRAAITGASENGQFRLYPVSALTPGGLLAADVRGEVRGEALDVTAEAEITEAPAGHAAKTGRAHRPTTLVIRATAEAARISGNLTLTAPDPLSAVRILGLGGVQAAGADAAPPEASFKAVFSLTPGERIWDRLDVTSLEARLGPDAATGNLAVKNGPSPAVELGLHLDALDAERIAALFSAAPENGDTEAISAPTSVDPGPRPTFSGRVTVGKASLFGVEAKNLSAEGHYRHGRAEATSLDGDLLGGKLSGRLEAAFTPGAHRVAINAAVTGADAGTLTNRLLTGPCTLRLAAEGAGDTGQAVLAALSGRVEAEMSRELKPGRGSDTPPFTKVKAGVDFKGRPGRSDNGAADAGSYDLAISLAASGPTVLREIKAEAKAVATPGKGGMQVGQGRLSGTATLAFPTENGERDLPVTLGAEFSLDPAKGAFAARGVTLETAGTKGSGKLEKKGRDEGGTLSGSFDFPSVIPRDVLAALGFSSPDRAAREDLRSGSLSFQVAENAAGLEFKNIVLHLDDMRTTGSVHLRSGFGRPRITLDVTHLDWDRYFPPEPAGPKAEPVDQDKPIDLAALRGYDLEARLRFGWIKRGNLVWKNGQTEVFARQGVFSARHEALDFYGGRFLAEIKGDARDVVLKTSLDLQIDGFDGATFLKEWAEGDVLASGGTTFVLTFKSNGLTERALRRNISGSARFQVTRGALKIRESGNTSPAPASAPGSEHQAIPATPAPSAAKPAAEPKYDLLPFRVLSSSYAVREGVAITNDFLIDGKEMRVDGSGYVDLRDESIDLSVTATLDSGTKIPATIRGPLEDPKLEIDRSKLFGDMVYRILKGIITMPGKALGKIFNLN